MSAGKFWVENLPLAAGTNNISIIATDAVGNLSSSNLVVVKSSVTLTITSTPEGGGLYEPSGTVSGTVIDASYGVIVNGTTATVYDTGDWIADHVPNLGQGTATFDALATPSGGGGGGPELRNHDHRSWKSCKCYLAKRIYSSAHGA